MPEQRKANIQSQENKEVALPGTEVRVGEYLPADHRTYPVKSKRGSFRRSLLWGIVAMMLILFFLVFGRQWYDSVLVRIDHNKSVHSDKTIAKSGVRSQVRPKVTLVYQSKKGEKVKVIADAQEYSDFVNQHTAQLEKARTQLLVQQKEQLHRALTQVFDEIRGRIDRFADWYFSYSTTYKILGEAITSTTQHLLAAEAVSLKDAVAYDVEKYLLKHYENSVLRPEITDSKLQAVYRNALQSAHDHYVDTLSTMQADFLAFVASHTTHLDASETRNAQLVLDWSSQFNKINVANYEKGPQGAAVGALLVVGGASAGKAIASVVGKGVASKAVATAASKGFFAKLSAPFVSKAVLASTGGAAGSFGGPIGVGIGVLGGLGIDYAINEGVELAQHDVFIADVGDALTATQEEWEKEMGQSLQEAINIWVDDTIQLLPRYHS